MKLTLYPNPVQRLLNIEIPSFNELTSKIFIMDTAGDYIIEDDAQLNQQTKTTKKVDISMLENGVYFIRVIVGENHLMQRFIKD